MTVYKINFNSSSTVVDSIKISRAVTFAYSILYPDKIDNFISGIKNGEIAFSNIFPIDGKTMLYPVPAINNHVINTKREERLNSIKNRKNVSKFIDAQLLSKIINNFIENDFRGVEYSKIFDEAPPEKKEFIKPVTEPGIVFLEEPVFQNDRWKYNEVFTKELYLYGEGYFIVENSDKFVNAAIMLLNDLGISGRRDSGKGMVSIRKSEDDMPIGFNNPGFYILLSSYIPDEDSIKSIDFSKSRYNIETFQGKSINGNPIGPFRYFKPGSVLYIKDKVKGKTYPDENGIMIFNPVLKEVQNEGYN